MGDIDGQKRIGIKSRKSAPTAKRERFDDVGNSVDSGRLSRRGAIDYDVISSDEESDKGRQPIADAGQSMFVNDDNVARSGEDTGHDLEGEGTDEVRWADSQCTTGETVHEYRSAPSSRQGDYVDQEHTLRENLRVSKSASIIGTVKDGRHLPFHKSKSLPVLRKTGEQNETPNNANTTEAEHNYLAKTEAETGFEQLPSRGSGRFSKAVAVVSNGNKLKGPNVNNASLQEKRQKRQAEFHDSDKCNSSPENSLSKIGKRKSNGNMKSVTWSDAIEQQNSDSNHTTQENVVDSIISPKDELSKALGVKPPELMGEHFSECPSNDSKPQPDSTNEDDGWGKVPTKTCPAGIEPPILPCAAPIDPYFHNSRLKNDQIGKIYVTLETLRNRPNGNRQSTEQCVEFWEESLDELVNLERYCSSLPEPLTETVTLLCNKTAVIKKQIQTTLTEQTGETSEGNNIEDCGIAFQNFLEEASRILSEAIEAAEVEAIHDQLSPNHGERNVKTVDGFEEKLLEPFKENDGSNEQQLPGADPQCADAEHYQTGESVDRGSEKKSSETGSGLSDTELDVESENSAEFKIDLSEWARAVCVVGTAEADDGPVTCVTHFDPHIVTFSKLTCNVVDPTSLPPVTCARETLVERVIHLSAEDLDQSASKICFLLAIPYRSPLVELWQEVEIRELTDTGQWKSLPPTTYRAVLDEQQHSSCYIETLSDHLGTFAVVAKSKADRMKFASEGGVMRSSVDHRVRVNIAENTCYGDCDMILQVSFPDPCAIYDFRSINEEFSSFKACTPIVDLEFTEDITNAVKVALPMTMPQKRLVRAGGRMSSGSTRHAPVPDPFDENELLLFHKKDLKEWKLIGYTKITNVSAEPGVVSFEWFEKKGRFAVICAAKDLLRKTIDPKASVFLTFLTLKPVEITIDQDTACPRQLSVTICPKQFGVRRRRLRKDETEHIFVKEMMLRDGQVFDVNLRGNLVSDFVFPVRHLYYSVYPLSFSFEVSVKDKYSQRSLSHFCGFLQALDPLRILMEPRAGVKGKVVTPQAKEAPFVLTEICVKIAKPPKIPLQPLVRAPLNINLNGGVSFDTLREVALEFGDEWKQLARSLHVSHARIQSILRNTKGRQPEFIALEILLSWVKRVPISKDKASLLCEALQRCGRLDLVKYIRERDRRMKQAEVQRAAAYNLKKAIVIVSRSPSASRHWRHLALGLGLPKTDVADLDMMTSDDTHVCRMALERWHNRASPTADVRVLAEQLSLLGCYHVAELITTAYGNL